MQTEDKDVLNLQKQIGELQKDITKLSTELKHTKDIIKKYNELRCDLQKLTERMATVEATDEADYRYNFWGKKDTANRLAAVTVIITAAMVLITVLNL